MNKSPFRALFLVCLGTATACSGITGVDELPEDSNNPLTPVTAFVGMWQTALPVTFRLQSDPCGYRETFAEQRWNVTWIMSAVPNDPNRVRIAMRRSAAGPFQNLNTTCGQFGTGYVPWNEATFEGTVSGTAISVNTINFKFSGSLTSGQINGTWDHWECLLLCFGETTAPQELKLTRQG